jgi:hypothetical protein
METGISGSEMNEVPLQLSPCSHREREEMACNLKSISQSDPWHCKNTMKKEKRVKR